MCLRKISMDPYVLVASVEMLYTRVATNIFLKKISKKNSGLCDDCKMAVETNEYWETLGRINLFNDLNDINMKFLKISH